MKRGDIYTARERGALTGKPRPVLVVQNDTANSRHTTVTVCFLSTHLAGHASFRVPVAPSAENGLIEASEVQADRLFTYQRDNLHDRIGRLAPSDILRVDQALRRWLDL